MSPGIPKLRIAAVLVALSVAGRTPAEDAPPAPPAGETVAAHATRLKLRTPIETYFTSNLFHVQDRRIAGFDGKLGPGERFHGMNAIWDLVLRPSARAAVEVPLGRKRDLEAGVGADYFLHQQNGIADYLRLSADASCDLTRHDRVEVEARLAPRRLDKNRHVPEPVVDPADPTNQALWTFPFEHAYTRESQLRAGYEHGWSRALATRLEYRVEQSAYEDPFRNRDELLNEARASVLLDLGRGSRIEITGGLGLSGSPGERERSAAHPDGIVVDRSFRQAVLLGKARFDASPATTIEAKLSFRDRSFTTEVSEDSVYHQRSDQLYGAEVAIDRRVGPAFALGAFAGFGRKYSNRSDPNLAPDEAGYSELVLGGALSWRYSTRGDR